MNEMNLMNEANSKSGTPSMSEESVFIEGFSNSMDERLIKPHKDDLQVMEIGRYYALHRMGAMSLREASEALANLEDGKRVKVSHETLRRYFRILDREIHGIDLDGVCP